MNLEILYKQFSGNDSFKTPEDRQSVYLEKLEQIYPGTFCKHKGNWTVTRAIALFYPNAMEKFAAELGGSYYVEPTDDAAILIPASAASTAGHYFYNAETGIFSQVERA